MKDIYSFEPLWGTWYIEAKIGEGASGKVYRAVRKEYGNVYHAAIKHISIPATESEYKALLDDGMFSDEASARAYFSDVLTDFFSEINLMSNLKGHTNIVSFEDHLVVEKRDMPGFDVFIRMELLTPLNDRAAGMTITDVCNLGIDICAAIEVLEKHNIIHRDIKPSNILCTDDGVYKLSDFSVSRLLKSGDLVVSKKGTPPYMSPEVYNGHTADSRSDIYSLGLVLHRLLNNNVAPFISLGETPSQSAYQNAIEQRMSGQPIPFPLRCDAKLGSILNLAYAFNPNFRFQKAADFKQALIEFKAEIPIVKKSASETDDSADKTSDNGEQKNKAGQAKKVFSKKAKRLSVATACFVGLFTIAFIVYGCVEYFNPQFEPSFSLPWETSFAKSDKMPQVVGLTKESATALMDATVANYYYTYDFSDTVPTGCVIRASIDVGSSLSNRDTVELVISLGSASSNSNTPDTTSPSAIATPTPVVATPMPTTGYYDEGTLELMGLTMVDNEGIAIYGNEILGITPDTTVSYTGYPYVFDNWTRIVSLSTSADSIIGLKGDGTVIAYGSNEYGQCDVSTWTNVEQVAAGGTFTLGLTESKDKILFAGKSNVGSNADIQNAVNSWNRMHHISAGQHHAVGKVLGSNTVVAAGDNSYGQCNVSHWTDIQVVVAGDNHTVGLRNDGTVVATGSNDQGQCNVEGWTNIVSIAAAGNHTIGLRSDGTVLSTKGCEIGTHSKSICGIAAGDEFYIAVLGDNSVISSSPEYRYALMAWTVEYSCEERWFNAKYSDSDRNISYSYQTADTVNSVNSDLVLHTMPSVNGYLEKNALNILDNANISYDVVYSDSELVKSGRVIDSSVTAGALLDENTVVTLTVSTGHSDNATAQISEPMPHVSPEDIVDSATLKKMYATIKNSSLIASYKKYVIGIQPDGTVIHTGSLELDGWNNIVALSSSLNTLVGLKADGTVVATGLNSYGQCEISDWHDITDIAAGSFFTLGLKSDGSVVFAGTDTSETFGGNNIGSWSDIRQVVAGRDHAVGLRNDGTVVAAGSNTYGQCNVSSWTDIVAIAAGSDHTVGLRLDGTVVATGANADGQCNVSEWTDIIHISAADTNTIALCGDGTAIKSVIAASTLKNGSGSNSTLYNYSIIYKSKRITALNAGYNGNHCVIFTDGSCEGLSVVSIKRWKLAVSYEDLVSEKAARSISSNNKGNDTNNISSTISNDNSSSDWTWGVGTVPNVIGLPLDDAISRLLGNGLSVSYPTPSAETTMYVVGQSIKAGTLVEERTKVYLETSPNPQSSNNSNSSSKLNTITVPDVVGLPLDDAIPRLLGNGLSVSYPTPPAETTMYVVSQSHIAGTLVEERTKVYLETSPNPP